MHSDNFFGLSYDRTTKIVSALVCVLPLVVAVATRSIVPSVILIFIVVLGYAYSPRGYVVSERDIIIQRVIGNARISLAGFREARRATAEDLRGTLRLWGSGGFFGYFGVFRTSHLGRCRWYVTNRRNLIVVILDEVPGKGAKTALFSPDDVDGFLASLPQSGPIPPGRNSTSAG